MNLTFCDYYTHRQRFLGNWRGLSSLKNTYGPPQNVNLLYAIMTFIELTKVFIDLFHMFFEYIKLRLPHADFRLRFLTMN